MSTRVKREIDYPESDGKPMAETDIHRIVMFEVINRLRARYAQRSDAYVSGNLLVLYVEGQPKVFTSPDAFVVFGVPNHIRRSYKVWEEGRYPDVVFEISSRKTRTQDVTKKFELYRDVWQVSEYFLFDPLDEYLKPALKGFRLIDHEYQPIESPNGILTSKLLGITIQRRDAHLLMHDIATGQEVLTEYEQRAIQADARAIQADARAIQADARAIQADARAIQAEQNALAVDAENARLRAELAALRQQKPSV